MSGVCRGQSFPVCVYMVNHTLVYVSSIFLHRSSNILMENIIFITLNIITTQAVPPIWTIVSGLEKLLQ